MNAGDVVVFPFFPHEENRNAGEARWGIILEDLGSGYLVVPMTCQQNQEMRYSKTIKISKLSHEGVQMGLTCDALIIGDRATEFPKIIFKRAIQYKGSCPEELLDEILNLVS